MRIKSAFKDYYDGICQSDGDYTTLFLRGATRNVKEVKLPFNLPLDYDGNSYISCVGFSGKLYLRNGRLWQEEILKQNWNQYLRNWIEKTFESCKKGWDEGFQKYGPQFEFYVSYQNNVFTQSPKLMGTGFEAVVPPQVAYMELYKFLCNQNRPVRPVPDMSNDIKIEQHGFDLRRSFRKQKGT